MRLRFNGMSEERREPDRIHLTGHAPEDRRATGTGTQMRAPRNRQIGLAAQSAVKTQFELLGWGVSPNPEHDLGTDHWVMARDEQLNEMRRLIGVQVKTGTTPFRSPRLVDGEIEGWWFRENGDSHFNYWANHSVPHILALHNLQEGLTFWVHVTADKVVPTGKGRKIFVPATNTLDTSHLHALRDVALHRAELPSYQGSAWQPGSEIPEEARLRYAMTTPRLIAPHGNRTPTAVSPDEAIALLVQMRLRDMDRWSAIEPKLGRDAIVEGEPWQWMLHNAMQRAVLNGDLSSLRDLVHSAPSPHEHAALAAALVALDFETGDIPQAMTVIDAVLTRRDLDHLDRAWMLMHQARLLVESGDERGAQEAALTAARAGRAAPTDPTAAMIAGAATDLVFNLGSWDSESLEAAIRGRDNLGAWWRAQTLVSALGRQADDAFKAWGRDKSATWGAEDIPWLRLRSAMLLAGHAADTPAWRNAASLLARRTLMTTDKHSMAVNALNLLRLSGDDKAAVLTARRMLESGPVEALAAVVDAVDLSSSTRTSLAADVRLVGSGADLLSPVAADKHALWAMRTLRDSTDLEARLQPKFIVSAELITFIRRVSVAVSPGVEDEVRQYLTDLPPVTDQLESNRYAQLVRHLVDDDWRPEQVSVLKARAPLHERQLGTALGRVVAVHDRNYRQDLAARVSAGDWEALDSFGNVTELPPEAVDGAIAALENAVKRRVEETTPGVTTRHSDDPLHALVMLNAWHPDRARWDAVMSALGSRELDGYDLSRAVELIGLLHDQIPKQVAQELAKHIADRASGAGRDEQGDRADWRGARQLSDAAVVALARLRPDELDDARLLHLLAGDEGQRVAGVEALIAGCRADMLAVLVVLTRDESVAVRSAVARGLAEWMTQEVAAQSSERLLDQILAEPGTALGVAISAALIGEKVPPAKLEPLLVRLSDHPSAIVRWRATRTLSRITAT